GVLFMSPIISVPPICHSPLGYGGASNGAGKGLLFDGGAFVSGGGFEGLPNASIFALSNRSQKCRCARRPVTSGPGSGALVVSAAALRAEARLIHPTAKPTAIGLNFVRVRFTMIFIFYVVVLLL